MRQERLETFSDGSEYFGDPRGKIIGPTPEDIRYFNSLPNETSEISTGELLLINRESRLGKVLDFALGKIPKRVVIPTAAVLGIIAAGCTPKGGGDNEPPTPIIRGTQTPSESPTPGKAPATEDWYLTAGPHYDGLSNGIKYAIDVAPKEVRFCPGSEPLESQPFPSPAEGEVITAEDKNNPQDQNHSIVVIKLNNGEELGAMHLANIRVIKGDHVKQGDLLGDPSCEFPPGGKTDGEHIHLFKLDENGKPIPIEGTVFQQGTVFASSLNKNGTLEKPDKPKRTADTGRCGPDEKSIKKCKGIRNDIEGPLVLLTTPTTHIEVRYANGLPVKDDPIDIYTQGKDINGNPILKKLATGGSTGNSGDFVFSENLREFMVVFPDFFGQKVYGEKIDNNLSGTGVKDVQTKSLKDNTLKITLGRIVVNIKDDPSRPTEPFFQNSRKTAETCIYGQDETERMYRIKCIDLNDLSQQNTLDQSKAVFNLLPGKYILEYDWWDGTNGWKSYFATVGDTQVVPGQTAEFYCLIFAPSNRNDSQPSDCSILPR